MPAHLIAEEGPYRGLTIQFEDGQEWVIGRDPDTCDFVIEDGTVSRRHVRLTKTPEGVYLKNLSRVNPTLINDEERSGAILLHEGDRIQVGNTVLLYSEEEIPTFDKQPDAPEKSAGGYDDIFGDIESPAAKLPEIEEEEEEPELPPPPPKPEMTAYDTIFEDTGIEEDIPFSLTSENPLMLKVIAGPNAGAEIGIERGHTYTIGKDANACDIVFQDLSVSRNHARLEVNADGMIEIEDLGSKNGISVNGSLIQEKKIITSQDLIALGTSVFMIIDREAPQETIYSSIPPSDDHATEDSSLDRKPTPEEALAWKKKPIPMKFLIFAGSAAAVFLIMFVSFFSLFKSNQIEIAGKEPVSEIKDALAKYTDVQYSYNPGSGKLFLVGHVLTNVDYQEMNFRLGEIDFITSIEDNVVIDEGVWQTMNDIITANPNWRGVSIHSPTAGKFVVNGYIQTVEEATQLYEYLTVNFPYLDKLENNVVIEQTLDTQLRAIVASANLGTVTLQLSNGSVILTGMYNEKMTREVNKTIKEINETKGVRSVQNFAIASHPSRIGIDISQEYQVTGTSTFDGKGYSAVMNGKIYTLGDQVDGMKITAIESNTILLEKDGLNYKIDYSR
jgi:type III secretion system YscD/HrpQ family protein